MQVLTVLSGEVIPGLYSILVSTIHSEQNMEPSRRGSVSITAHSGPTLAIHTRTQDEEDLPHATKRFVALVDTLLSDRLTFIRRTMADHLRRYESLCAILPSLR